MLTRPYNSSREGFEYDDDLCVVSMGYKTIMGQQRTS